MFREIRKKKNEISPGAAKQLLHTQRRGVLSMQGEDGYPYGVPINYLYSEADGMIYFHSSRVGYKVDCLKKCAKVCFTVCGNETVTDEAWAPCVQSAVVFGVCRPVCDPTAAMELVRKFACKYYPDESLVDAEIARSGKAVQMFAIEIEHLSGKEVREK